METYSRRRLTCPIVVNCLTFIAQCLALVWIPVPLHSSLMWSCLFGTLLHLVVLFITFLTSPPVFR